MPVPDRYELIAAPQKQVAYLFPERINNPQVNEIIDTSFVFQYWPESLSDSQGVEYASNPIPGGSHPLHQYVGGGERTISFDATFTSEIEDSSIADKHSGIPSAPYTVDIRAAIARLESFKLARYPRNGMNSRVIPPPQLVLVFPGTNLGRNSDHVVVILKELSWNYISWFPSGVPRVVQTSMSFSESVQRRTGRGSNIKFVGREVYSDTLLNKYNSNRSNVNSIGTFDL